MGRSTINTAAIKIDGVTPIKTGEDYPAVEGVIAAPVDEPDIQEELGRISELNQVAPQHAAGSIPDTELIDEFGIK